MFMTYPEGLLCATLEVAQALTRLRSPAFFLSPRLVVKPTSSLVQIRHPHHKQIPPAQGVAFVYWRTRRDSNPRPSASEADTLSN